MIFCPDRAIPNSVLTGLNNTYIYIYVCVLKPRERIETIQTTAQSWPSRILTKVQET